MDLVIKEHEAIVPLGKDSLFFNEAKFALAERVAEIFASSTMVPKDFRGNKGNCLIVLNLASRLNADPMMLMQNIYIVPASGKPGFEGKLVIALVNACGRFDPLEFDEDSDGCTAFTKDLKSGKVLKGTRIDMAMVKAEGWIRNSKWQSMRAQMFRYRSAVFFARVYCPEVIMGMQTREELQDITDLARGSDGTYTINEDLKGKTQEKIDALKEKVGESLAAEAGKKKALEADQEKILAGKNVEGKLVDPGKPEDFETDEGLDESLWVGIPPDDMPAGPPLWREENYKGRRTGNGTTTGLAGWVNRNRHILLKAPNEALAKIITKWSTHYKTSFPTLTPPPPNQDQDENQKTAHSSSEPPPGGNDESPPGGNELPAQGGDADGDGDVKGQEPTINRTGFKEIDEAIEALGPDGPGIYAQAKVETGFKDGAHTTEMAIAIAKRMSRIVDMGGNRDVTA